jgi:hypothetical protein
MEFTYLDLIDYFIFTIKEIVEGNVIIVTHIVLVSIYYHKR